MTTCFTSFIEDGKITNASDFLMLCAREFGACISMRDEPLSTPIPNEFVPNTTPYDRSIQRLESELRQLESMTLDEAQKAADQEFQTAQNALTERQQRARLLMDRYDSISRQICGWKPPTKEHEALKEFALDQIRGSRQSQCELDRSVVGLAMTGQQWLDQRISQLRDVLETTKAYRQREIEETARRNQWLHDLRQSLEGINLQR